MVSYAYKDSILSLVKVVGRSVVDQGSIPDSLQLRQKSVQLVGQEIAIL